MNTYIALLRGINVGGRNPLPMKQLVLLLEGLGCRKVKTYIQSGNVAFQSGMNDSRLAMKIRQEIGRHHGFEPYVLLLTIKDLRAAIAANPFPDAESDPSRLHVGFLEAVPFNPDLDKLETVRIEAERFQLIDKVFYLHAPDGLGRSKVAANAERLLGVAMTDRNWRTVTKLQELAEEVAR